MSRGQNPCVAETRPKLRERRLSYGHEYSGRRLPKPSYCCDEDAMLNRDHIDVHREIFFERSNGGTESSGSSCLRQWSAVSIDSRGVGEAHEGWDPSLTA